jgi:hypothetical protein
MTIKIDASSDQSYAKLNQLNALYGPFPDYVKQASREDALVPVGLLPRAYADDIGGQLPCHTKAACLLSAAYFLEGRDQLPKDVARHVANRLEKAAADHGILADLEKLVQLSNAHVKSAQATNLPDSEFAYIKQAADGSRERHYPIRNPEEVKVAAAWFAEHRDHFSFGNRQAIAERILDKAAALSVSFEPALDDLLEKQAGRGVYDPIFAAGQLRFRAKLDLLPETMKQAMLKLADGLELNPVIATDLATTIKIATIVDQYDRAIGLNRKYSRFVQRPEDIFFSGSLKQASTFVKNACPTPTGSIYNRDDLSRLSVGQVADLFGTKIAHDVSEGLTVDTVKLARVIANVPLRAAIELDRYLAAIDIMPTYTKASALAISETDRQKMARDYVVQQASDRMTTDSIPMPSGARSLAVA